ncbi:MAG: hypothetical protein R6V01_10765 [Thermoplasmatota archaeon]
MENKDIIKIAVGGLIGLLLLSIVLGLFGFGYGMMGGMMLGMGIFWILVIIVPIVLIVYFISNSSSKGENRIKGYPDSNCDLAMEDLRGRYAKGEISRDTYFEIKKDLEKDCPPS